ncbi:MAG: AMP-binding protein, partial [bacterium]|nr:AMP-binding protein [bacterium]
MVDHGNLTAYLHAFYEQFDVNASEIVLQQASFTFDAFVEEVYPPLLRGGKVVIAQKELVREIYSLAEYIQQKQVSFISVSPQLLNELNKYQNHDSSNRLESIRVYISGGDVLKVEYVDALLKTGRVYNTYGPTEGTVCASYYQCKGTEQSGVPIGKPIANYQIYILDQSSGLQPIGVPGELCIIGAGVTRGYLNRPELTAERFVNYKLQATNYKQIKNNKKQKKDKKDNKETKEQLPQMGAAPYVGEIHESPFSPKHPSGIQLYRSGDLARWLPDGNIEFLGRIDRQVKIRGYRIETGEIESCLLRHVAVDEVVVIVRESKGGDKALCAYYVLESARHGDFNPKEYLGQFLPDYMIPSFFIKLETIPLTPNGKIDRKALSQYQPANIQSQIYIAPRNEIEEKIIDIWAAILETQKGAIGIDDDFFHLGGHSLKAIQAVSRIHKELDVKIELAKMFSAPTVRQIGAIIKTGSGQCYKAVEKAEEREYYPLSSLQERMFILHRIEEGQTAYNIFNVLKVEGIINKQRLDAAFKTLIRRHESLRTTFKMVQGKPVQQIHPTVEFKIDYLEAAEKEVTPVIEACNSPFDLEKAPMLRAGLIRLTHKTPVTPGEVSPVTPGEVSPVTPGEVSPVTPGGVSPVTPGGEENHLLLFNMHHIISDGTSVGILVREFLDLYEGSREPAELRLQYRDFSQWQSSKEGRGITDKQEIYWQQQFAGEQPVLDMPTDYQRPTMQSFRGAARVFTGAPGLKQRLETQARQTGTTLFMVLMTAYNIVLANYARQEDIVVGTPVSGRRHADFENLIGLFINVLAIRNTPRKEKLVGDFLEEVKGNTLRAFENQEYPFGELVEKLDPGKKIGRNPIYDVELLLQNFEMPVMETEGLRFTPYETELTNTQVDITLTIIETTGTLTFTLNYCTDLFKQGTMERFFKHYLNILEAVSINREISLGDVEMMTEKERHQIVEQFNRAESQYPIDETVTRQFLSQVETTPHRIALDYKNRQISYNEMNEKANNLARLLRTKGLRTGDIVGLMTLSTPEMMIAIFAILKAGGAYLPIAPDAPKERIQYMLKDSNAKLLVNEFEELHELHELKEEKKLKDLKTLKELGEFDELDGLEIIDINTIYQLSASTEIQHPSSGPQHPPSRLAYIIYTSGTTGRPKGVMVNHGNLTAYLHAFYEQFDISASEIVLQQASFTFDAFVEEMYPALLRGGKVVIAQKELVRDISSLAEYIQQKQVSFISVSPQLLNELNKNQHHDPSNRLESIRVYISGGDELKPGYVDALVKTGRVYNTYGPTEGTVCASYYQCKGTETPRVPIGKPIANYQIYILDQSS